MSTLKQRKFLARRENQKQFNLGKCDCGGTLIMKDHGTWIGYFCPKCKGGGSRTK